MRRTIPLLLLAAMTGCASATYEIHGQVTLDGNAVPDAQIQFVSSDETLGPAFARTKSDGRYSVVLRKGDYSVRILAQKSVAAPPGTIGQRGRPLAKITVDALPRKYSTESELRATVTGPGDVDFKLTSESP